MVSAPDWVTTNEQFYGFRDMYPELYDAAAAATRARPAENLTFKSAYSDSLKAGSGEYWKQFLCTTYGRTNASVHKGAAEASAALDPGFVAWVQKQRLYYGDLLTDAAAAKMDTALAQATAQKRGELLAAMRLMFAAARPDKCALCQ